jgi:two-component system response regulator NreC
MRVLIVDDHTLVRSGLRLLLESQGIEVAGEAADGEEAVAMVERSEPDVVLLDLTMPPGKDGIWATEAIKARRPGCAVLVLTMHDEEALLFRVLQAGASGYVLKQAADTDLVEALTQVHAGGTYLYPSAARPMVEEFLRRVQRGEESPLSTYRSLTDREREILTLIAEGYGNKEIAVRLDISVKTVETHKARIMEKLNLYTRADLVRYALRRGLLVP